MESYARAKQKLFETPGLKHAVLNLDDVQGARLARVLAGRGLNRAGYSCFEGVAARAGLEYYSEAHAIDVSARESLSMRKLPGARRASRVPC